MLWASLPATRALSLWQPLDREWRGKGEARVPKTRLGIQGGSRARSNSCQAKFSASDIQALCHPTLFAKQVQGSIHQSAWKGNSANFTPCLQTCGVIPMTDASSDLNDPCSRNHSCIPTRDTARTVSNTSGRRGGLLS